ncbi:hypothetical protein F5Y03DRAFT_396639 [Xylaria venustula]|nr:hypothetical protein F5Y03DRAFT_396639 [Xylaria venustula]
MDAGGREVIWTAAGGGEWELAASDGWAKAKGDGLNRSGPLREKGLSSLSLLGGGGGRSLYWCEANDCDGYWTGLDWTGDVIRPGSQPPGVASRIGRSGGSGSGRGSSSLMYSEQTQYNLITHLKAQLLLNYRSMIYAIGVIDQCRFILTTSVELDISNLLLTSYMSSTGFMGDSQDHGTICRDNGYGTDANERADAKTWPNKPSLGIGQGTRAIDY